jgi:hypothetical protein
MTIAKKPVVAATKKVISNAKSPAKETPKKTFNEDEEEEDLDLDDDVDMDDIDFDDEDDDDEDDF